MKPIRKVIKLIVSFIFVLILSGCLVDYDTFKHEETHHLLSQVSVNDFIKSEEFTDQGILIIPHFRKLTNSFPVPESFLRFYSLTESSIYIFNAIITSKNKGFEYKLDVNNLINLNNNNNNESFYTSGVRLFDHNNLDINEVLKQEFITLNINYEINGNKGNMVFKIIHKRSKDIAWKT
ncbi:hypothetical protein A9Q79_02015 [Methylophaga sp. 42_25_T18]|nr:hypothetical protein A9Q79_02015 [Methylophaga sp. 42_25_T18]OUR88796.1 hypothetical protein A9Q92_02300 [Methylophaga sp. 42_8_T64]